MAENDTPRGTVLVLAALSSFLTPFMGSGLNVALPVIGREFGMSAVGLSWVATTYLLTTGVFLVPVGRWADIHGRKRVFRVGLLIFTLSSLLLVFAQSGGWLLACRALQGAGSAMIFSTNVAILVSVFPAAERGKVLGVSVAAVYLGLSLGPVLGGALTQAPGWRSIFGISAALGASAWWLVERKLSGEWAEARGEAYDNGGALTYGLALTTCGAALVWLPAPGGCALLAVGLAGLAGFVAWELKASSPLLDVGLFRHNRVFAFSNLAALINYAATAAVGFLLSLYLQHVKQLGPGQAGLVLLAQPALMALFSPLAGWLSDRMQPRFVASFGMALITAALVLLAGLHEATSLATLIALQMLLGLGFAFFSSPNQNAVMSSVARAQYGIAAAILGTMRLGGQVASMALVAVVFSLLLGAAPITPAVSGPFLASLKMLFLALAALCVVGTLASLARGRQS